MELNTTNLCYGCLSQNRKITSLSDATSDQCLMLIFNEFKMMTNETKNIYLCWECKAKLRNFVKFKEQVKCAYELLNGPIKMLKPYTSLSTNNIFNIELNLKPDNLAIKIEDDPCNNSDTIDYNSDDKSFLNYNNKRRKKKRSKKKSNISTLDKKGSLNHCNTNEKDNSDENCKQKDIEADCIQQKDKLTDHVEIKDESTDHIEIKDESTDHIEIKDESTDHVEIKDKSTDQVGIKVKSTDRVKNIFKIVNLNIEEVFAERKRLKESQDYVNAMFICEPCILSFPNEDDLNDHVQKKHDLNTSKHKCRICKCSFSTEVSLNYHKNTHIRRYQCEICNERTQNKRAAMKHYEITHCYSETYEFEMTNNKINGQSNTEILENNGEKEDIYSCELCDKTFRWKTSLRKHLEMHQIEAGQKRRPYCEPCGLTFTTTSNLQRHAKTSSKHQIKLKLRKLKETNQGDAELNDIKVSILSTKDLFPCPQCEKKFEWRGNMLRHLHTHNAQAKGELVCKPCNRKFSSKATYKQHLQISKKHVSEKDFKHMCSDCGKRYPNKWKLKEHVNWEHLKNYVHSCKDCQKVFKCNTSLYLHRQMAHKANECLCDLCGKSFSNKTKLQSHILALHSTEAPYKCKSCSARFTWQSCLSRHVRRLHNSN